MSLVRRSLRLGVVALTISLAIPLILAGTGRGLSQLGSVPAWLLLTALAMIAAGWLFNATRLRLLARNVGVDVPARRALAMVLSTEFAGAATPGGVGGPLTYVHLLHRHGIHSAQAASLYAVDHLMDLAFFSSALPLALIIFVLQGRMEHPLWFALATLGPLVGGAVVIVLFIRAHGRLLRALGWLALRLRIKPRARRRLARWAIHFRDTVKLVVAMPRPRLLALYAACAGHWLLRYSVLPLILYGLGETVPWSYLFALQGVLLFAGQLSLLPGGAGGVEVGFAALLAPWLDPGTLAVALLLWRFATFYWYLMLGGAVFALTVGRAPRPIESY
jgi:uncharacterized protein (TIRG00374 family)